MFETAPSMTKGNLPFAEVTLAGAGLCLFALLAHTPMPFNLLSFGGMLVSSLMLMRGLITGRSPERILGLNRFSTAVIRYTVMGLFFGFALGVLYRWGYGLDLLPTAFSRFAPVAALIGATEEVVYRGYMQGRMPLSGPFRASAIASLYHTAYKCALFVFPGQPTRINFLYLAVCTFGVGFLLGIFRDRSGSLLPAVAAHVIFDLMAYGEYAFAPWWVWN